MWFVLDKRQAKVLNKTDHLDGKLDKYLTCRLQDNFPEKGSADYPDFLCRARNTFITSASVKPFAANNTW
jgi:hypothetical protein